MGGGGVGGAHLGFMTNLVAACTSHKREGIQMKSL